jgi:hypothetical protein
MNQKTAPELLSSRATINLIALSVLLIIIGLIIPHVEWPAVTTAQQQPAILPGPTTVTRINDQVIELSWDGTPREGYNLSDVLPMRIGDRIVIYWLGGCFQARPLRECNQPWGFLDPAPENRGLFRYPRGQFAVHLLQGDSPRKSEIWPHGANEMIFTVRALPVRLVFNGFIAPGIYYGAGGVRIPVDGYTPPTGHLVFRIVNRR